MKKILFAAFAGLLFICASCNTDTTTTSDNNDNAQEQKNLAASDVISKAFQTGDVAGIDSVVSDDFIDHTDRGDMKGRDSLKAMVKFIHSNFKDMKSEKIRDVADGDYVYSWMRYTGTSDGSMGMPKGPYDMSAIELAKFKDGKAVEHWSFMDMQDMMKMMPQQPNMNNMNNMDTTKMKK
jgi:predicted SnoaL-like aldol condensation-catalyzing enzyme